MSDPTQGKDKWDKMHVVGSPEYNRDMGARNKLASDAQKNADAYDRGRPKPDTYGLSQDPTARAHIDRVGGQTKEDLATKADATRVADNNRSSNPLETARQASRLIDPTYPKYYKNQDVASEDSTAKVSRKKGTQAQAEVMLRGK